MDRDHPAVIRGGKINLKDLRAFEADLKRLEGERVVVTIRKLGAIRSRAANRYYWGCVLKILSEHTGHDAEDLHDWAKLTFLEREPIVLSDAYGEIKSAAKLIPSTTGMTTAEFYEFVERLRRWAAVELGCEIPDPDGFRDIALSGLEPPGERREQ